MFVYKKKKLFENNIKKVQNLLKKVLFRKLYKLKYSKTQNFLTEFYKKIKFKFKFKFKFKLNNYLLKLLDI